MTEKTFSSTRRALIAAAAAAHFIPAVARAAEPDLSALSDMTKGAIAIGADERRARRVWRVLWPGAGGRPVASRRSGARLPGQAAPQLSAGR